MNNLITNDDFYIKIKHLNTLFQFIKEKKEEEFIDYLIQLKPEEIDLNIKDENGNYLIIFSIIMNNTRILKKLIEYNSRIDIIDSDGYTILYYPIKYNYHEIINILIDNDNKIFGLSLINLKDSKGLTPLFYAIKYKNIYALQLLITKGADVNYKNNNNLNSLHFSTLKKDIIIINIIIKYIKNIDSQTNNGSTSLHYASNFLLEDVILLLLKNGANPNIQEYDYNLTPIFYSVIQNNIPITKILIDYKSDPNIQDYNGNNIIHYSIIYNHNEILEYIFLKYSINKKKYKMIFQNISEENINNNINNDTNYIDPNITNVDGFSIFHLLIYYYQKEYDKYIINILPYINLNNQDNNGNTILYTMVEKNIWQNFIELLENKKMNIFIYNNKGKSILDIINLNDREIFLNIIIKSYFNYLKKYPNEWNNSWENYCSVSSIKNIMENEYYEIIKKFILNEKISIPVKKNKKLITVNYDTNINFTTFTGSLLDLLCGFKYLLKKYPNTNSVFNYSNTKNIELDKYYQSLGIKENYLQNIIHFEIRWIYQKLFLPPNFEKIIINIINNNKYKFIIMIIGIILSNGNHSNGLFYDIEKNILERFEPHGSNYPSNFNYNPDLLDNILLNHFTNILSNIYKKTIKINYIKPKDYLPRIGFQIFENYEINVNKNIGDPNGFCALWTIWYLDYRIQYHDIRPDKIIKKLINKIRMNNYSFRTLIRNYSQNITNLRDNYLNKINKNINDYLNDKISENDIKILLIEILSDNN